MNWLPLETTIVPSSPAELAAAVREAYHSATPVYPLGGGTHLGLGVRPSRPGLGLSLAGLTRVIDYPARDLTITVQAGLTVAELQRHLALQRQGLPLDVAFPERATVGGVVAVNPIGPRHAPWASIREYVLGLSAVDGQGREFSAGGRVVKNAAGYNVCRLLTGSLGTLAVITQVTLMVRPLAEASALVACDLADWDMAERLLTELLRGKTPTFGAALLVGPAWRDHALLQPAGAASLGRLVVGLEGTRSEVDWMIGHVLAQWRRLGVIDPQTSFETTPWQRIAEFAADPAEDGAPVVVQLSVLPSDLVHLARLLMQVDAHCSLAGFAATGVLHVRLSGRGEGEARRIDARLRAAVAGMKGSMVVLRHPGGEGWDRQTVWGPAGPDAPLMQALKNQFDPKGILNCERYQFAPAGDARRASPP